MAMRTVRWFFSSFSFFSMHSVFLQTRGSDLIEMGSDRFCSACEARPYPATLPMNWLDFFATISFTFRVDHGSTSGFDERPFKRLSVQCVVDSFDVSAVKDGQIQTRRNGCFHSHRVDDRRCTGFKLFSNAHNIGEFARVISVSASASS